MRVLLCALTGLGNPILESLLAWPRMSALFVITRREPGRFPHYSCAQLDAHCSSLGIPCRTDLRLDSPEGLAVVGGFKPDVLICATFHQRIPSSVLGQIGRLRLNIHSSLLPALRGPTPTNWAILRGEEETGITFHQLSEGLDEGALYAQRRLAVGNRTDGELRHALAELAAAELRDVLDKILDGELAPVAQDVTQASSFPRVATEEGLKIILQEKIPLGRLERGLTPMPGPDFLERVLRGMDEGA